MLATGLAVVSRAAGKPLNSDICDRPGGSTDLNDLTVVRRCRQGG